MTPTNDDPPGGCIWSVAAAFALMVGLAFGALLGPVIGAGLGICAGAIIIAVNIKR